MLSNQPVLRQQNITVHVTTFSDHYTLSGIPVHQAMLQGNHITISVQHSNDFNYCPSQVYSSYHTQPHPIIAKYHTKAEFNNCFIIHSKYFQSTKNIQFFFNRVLSIGFTEKSLAT